MTNRNAKSTTSTQEEIMTSGIAMNGEQFAGLKHHRTASISPKMSETEFGRIKRDIAQNGMQEAIVLCDNKIIDGRSRHQAAVELIKEGVLSLDSVSIRNMPSDISPLDFILSMNMHRKHYNESQRALCAARMLPIFERAAAKNQKSGKKVGANLQQGRCNALVGKMVSVSARSVATAKKLQDSNCANLVDLVETGVMRLSVADQLLRFFEDNMSGLNSTLNETEKDIRAKVKGAFAKRLKDVKDGIAEVAKELGIDPKTLHQTGATDAITAACHDKKATSKKRGKTVSPELKALQKLQKLLKTEEGLLQSLQQSTVDYRLKNFSHIVKSKCSASTEYALTLVMEFVDGKFNPVFKSMSAATASNYGIVMEIFGSQEEVSDYMESHADELSKVTNALVPLSDSFNIVVGQLLTPKTTPLKVLEAEKVEIKENTLVKAS